MARHYQRVELFHQWVESGVTKFAWQDVTADVYNRQDIQINPPRGDEQGGTVTATAGLHLKTHRYNPKNAASDLYGLIGLNTPLRISSGDGPVQQTTFDYTAASGWAGTGALSWTLSGGTVPDDYSVNGNEGVIAHPNTNTLRYATVDTGDVDHRVRVVFDTSVADFTGAGVSVWVLGRFTDVNNYYAALVSYNTSEVATVALYKRVAGVLTQIAAPVAVANTGPGGGGNDMIAELYVEANRLYASCWRRFAGNEPLTWMVAAEDDDLTTGTRGGVTGRRETGNTNNDLALRFFDFAAVPGTIRFAGEVESWQPRRRRGADKDKWVEVTAYDVWNRVDQSKSPLRSALWRENLFGAPLAFWPVNDGSTATTAASALPGGQPMTIDPDAQWEPREVVAWVEPLMTPAAGTFLTLIGPVRQPATATEWSGDFVFAVDPTAEDADLVCVWTGAGEGTPGSPRVEWWLTAAAIELDDFVTYELFVQQWDGTFSPPTVSLIDGTIAVKDGRVHHFRVVTDNNGANTDWELFIDNTSLGSGTTAAAWDPVDHVFFDFGTIDQQMSAGMVAVWGTASPPANAANAAVVGRSGELVGDRLARLFAEEGIAFELVGASADTEPAGPQLIDTLAANAQACEDVDMGLLFGSRHQVGMTYRTRKNLYHQTPVELDFAAGELSDPLDPAVDTRGVVNDVTVSRPGGSSARSVAETGPLNVNPRHTDPQGVGRYDVAPQVNADTDAQLQGLADWRRFRGTQDVARYPQVPVDLDGLALHHKTALVRALVRMRLGDRLDILNLEGEPVAQLVPGYTETISLVRRLLTFNAVPAAVYDVGIFNDPASKYDSAYSTTAAQITTGTSTSLSVAVEAGRTLWLIGSGSPQFPIDINLLGARVRVTAIAGAASPQTFTIDAIVVNGINKVIPAGTPVRLWSPRRFGL